MRNFIHGVALFCLLALPFAGCHHKDASMGLGPGNVRCVFVENHTKDPLVFQITVNGAPPDTQIIEPEHGIFLYEPLADRTDANAGDLIQMSVTAPDKSMSGGKVISGELAAMLTTTGNLTASGWAGGTSTYGEPNAEWLADHHLEARSVHNLRSVVATFSRPEAPGP